MLSQTCLQELHTSWLPNITDAGLDRLIDLLEKGSPLLIHGSFTQAVPMGCLASHIAWNHPGTAHLGNDAGILWLNRIVGINPAASHVIRAWDACGKCDWQVRADLLEVLKEYRSKRQQPQPEVEPAEEPCLVEV
jgi:hypothetical protein